MSDNLGDDRIDPKAETWVGTRTSTFTRSELDSGQPEKELEEPRKNPLLEGNPHNDTLTITSDDFKEALIAEINKAKKDSQ